MRIPGIEDSPRNSAVGIPGSEDSSRDSAVRIPGIEDSPRNSGVRMPRSEDSLTNSAVRIPGIEDAPRIRAVRIPEGRTPHRIHRFIGGTDRIRGSDPRMSGGSRPDPLVESRMLFNPTRNLSIFVVR